MPCHARHGTARLGSARRACVRARRLRVIPAYGLRHCVYVNVPMARFLRKPQSPSSSSNKAAAAVSNSDELLRLLQLGPCMRACVHACMRVLVPAWACTCLDSINLSASAWLQIDRCKCRRSRSSAWSGSDPSRRLSFTLSLSPSPTLVGVLHVAEHSVTLYTEWQPEDPLRFPASQLTGHAPVAPPASPTAAPSNGAQQQQGPLVFSVVWVTKDVDAYACGLGTDKAVTEPGEGGGEDEEEDAACGLTGAGVGAGARRVTDNYDLEPRINPIPGRLPAGTHVCMCAWIASSPPLPLSVVSFDAAFAYGNLVLCSVSCPFALLCFASPCFPSVRPAACTKPVNAPAFERLPHFAVAPSASASAPLDRELQSEYFVDSRYVHARACVCACACVRAWACMRVCVLRACCRAAPHFRDLYAGVLRIY